MSLLIRAALHPPEAPPGLVSGLCRFFLLLYTGLSFAVGIDHTVSEDNSGIWKRSNQQALVYTLIGGEIAGAVWLGGEDRLQAITRKARALRMIGALQWRATSAAANAAAASTPGTPTRLR
jgi:hypothetical protein